MQCKLCLNERKLCKSHIIPEWLYEGLYEDHNHKLNLIFSNSEERRRTRPTGIYDKLLCRECELKLSNWESHAKDILRGNTEKKILSDRFAYLGVDYSKFKLFLLSIFWKASLSNQKGVYPVNLAPYTDRIRKMLYNEDPGQPHEFGTLVLYPEHYSDIIDNFIEFPKNMGNDPVPVYTTIFDGKFWNLFLTTNPDDLPAKFILLGPAGVLPVFSDMEWSQRFMLDGFISFKRAGMLDNITNKKIS